MNYLEFELIRLFHDIKPTGGGRADRWRWRRAPVVVKLVTAYSAGRERPYSSATEGAAGRLTRLPDGMSWESVSRRLDGIVTGKTLRNWTKDPGRLTEERAEWLTCVLAGIACDADGLGPEALYTPPALEEAPATWRLYRAVLEALGIVKAGLAFVTWFPRPGHVEPDPLHDADVRAAVHAAAAWTTEEQTDVLREAIADAVRYLDGHAVETLRPIVADYLASHPRRFGGEGESEDVTFDSNGNLWFSSKDADNASYLAARLAAWPSPPKTVSKWTDPDRIDHVPARWRDEGEQDGDEE